MKKTDLINIFDTRGKKINQNRKIFASKYRNELLKEATGNVLEAAVGTGTNLQFYPENIKLTAVDFSPVLLNLAEEKAVNLKMKVNFIKSDIETINFKDNTFDTIVSTLSLCAYDNPTEVLNSFYRWCKPNGRILLLEHGLSNHKFLDTILNKINNWSMRKQGCHTNLDVIETINKSKIKIIRYKQIFYGTHYLIWAEVKK
jgi:ubiquinone/menaquinone biosynthesis C-methylase UbiE